MKKTLNFIFILAMAAMMTSCLMFVRDNYEYPNSSVSGAIVDSLTGDPVQMDVAEGSYIQYFQKNYGPVEEAQNFTFFSDGTWRNTQVFAGTYDFVLQNQNFVPIDTIRNVVFEPNKDNHFEIKVLPLHNLHDWNIYIDEETNELVAGTYFVLNTTRLTDEVYAYYSDNIALFIDAAPYVGAFYNCYSQKMAISWPCIVDTWREFRISLDDPELSKAIKRGEKYYVRLGVQAWGNTDTSLGAVFQGIKPYNFTPPVRIQF